ncbi:MAG: hypothetical protein MI975_22215 [Cytophagales bacterium]|nr:hypothetical protein [Cytophagales bacterium]
MKNFDPDLVFHSKVTILNPSAVLPPESESEQEAKTKINFFPEGGDLVVNKESKIAVKVTDHNGRGLAISGFISDSEEHIVTRFETSDRGYSAFKLTPRKGISYFANIANRGKTELYELPEAKEDGLVIGVSRAESSGYRINLSGTEKFHKTVYLVVHTRGIIMRIEQIDINNTKQIDLLPGDLLPGISHVTILDEDLIPVVERLIFKYPKEMTYVNIELDKTEYTKREKIELTINPVNTEDGDTLARLSLSVFKYGGQTIHESNIISNLLLISDLKGKIEEPWIYFDYNNETRFEEIDLIMLTNGWRRFDWNNVLDDTEQELDYPAEINAPLLSGKILTSRMDQIPTKVHMNIPGKSSLINSTSINSDGIFHFEMPFRINSGKAYFFTINDTLRSDQIKLYSPFDLDYNFGYKDRIEFSVESRDYLETLNLNNQLSHIYENFTNINGLKQLPKECNRHFYGKPDHEYLLEDYTRFETIEDLFIEYVRNVKLKKVESDIGFYMINENGMLPEKALAMIDGVPIMDMGIVLNYDPLKIEKIELVNNIYHAGGINYYGIINFISYEKNISDHELPVYLVEKVYHALQHPRQFYSPEYSMQINEFGRIPDFRTTLYWDADVKLNFNEKKTIEFYSSDDEGLYKIEVNGITNRGKPIYEQYKFEVH